MSAPIAVPPSPSPSTPGRVRRWLRREGVPLAVMLVLLVVARSSLANHYHVPTGSMEPTLMPGDRVVVDMRAYGVRAPLTGHTLWSGAAPARGDVVVFRSPGDGTRLIKRVAAVAGDRVDLADGYLSINGRALAAAPGLPEDFGARQATLDLDAGGGPDIRGLVVPDGQVLVLGDHRGMSFDGRYFGLVPSDAIYGQARGVYWRRGDGLRWQRL